MSKEMSHGTRIGRKGSTQITVLTPTCVLTRVVSLCAMLTGRKQGYLDGPITAEEYVRFEYYAQFVRTLRYTIRERISPTVFFFLQQHAHDRPLFPNVRELVWVHPVPELLSVLSPTIRVLRFPPDDEDSENCGRPQEIGYRMLRHTFKTLLPGMLERLPELLELELPPLRHEGFWEELARGPKARFCAQGLRSLVITEPFTVLLQGALAVISTISGLEELRITSDLPVDWNGLTRAELAALDRHDGEALRPLAKLRVLHIRSNPPAVALLMELIVAPNLEDVTLQFSVHPTARQLAEIEYTSEDEVDALHDAVQTLCSAQRSATLSSVKLMLLSFKLPERRRVSETETVSSLDALIKPLLQLHRLQDLVIDIWFIDNAPAVAMVPDMLAAWPTLQRLNIPALSLSPDDFRIAARISPELKSIRAMRLSDEFLELPGTSAGVAASATVERAPTRGHPLQDIRLYSPSKISDPANVTKIARFLCELFPRFGSTQCVGPKLARRYENQENWRDVVKQAQKIQKANQ